MFGTDFKRILETKYDKTYSGFLNPVKQNDLIAEALSVAVLDGYRSLQAEEMFVDMSNLIRTNKVFYLNNNQIYIWFLDITNVTFVGLVVTVTTRLPNNLAIGDSVTLRNIAGFTAPTLNGTAHTVTAVTANTFVFTIAAIAGAYTAGTGQLVLNQFSGVDKLVSDFNYLLAAKQKYYQRIKAKVTGASNAQPIVMTLDKRNNLKSGEYVYQSGIVGNTNANGNFYIKKLNNFKYALYRDKDLTIPVSGNGEYQGIGVVDRIFYKVATPMFSSTKIDQFEQASVSNPKYERADGLLKFHPLDQTCQEVSIDYVTLPPVAIDVTNGVIDLEDTYAPEFLYYVLEKAVNLFAQYFKDTELYQTSAIELKQK
jgi:hypothetical protein